MLSIMYSKVRVNAILNCDYSEADNQFSAWNLRVFKVGFVLLLRCSPSNPIKLSFYKGSVGKH